LLFAEFEYNYVLHPQLTREFFPLLVVEIKLIMDALEMSRTFNIGHFIELKIRISKDLDFLWGLVTKICPKD
jgi:hypothetical protein